MKKLLLISALMLCFTTSATAWNEVQPGVYMDNLQLGDNTVSYSIKVEKKADMWRTYMPKKGIDEVEYMEGDFTINCETGTIKGKVSIYDRDNELLSEGETSDVPNKDIFAVCTSIKEAGNVSK